MSDAPTMSDEAVAQMVKMVLAIEHMARELQVPMAVACVVYFKVMKAITYSNQHGVPAQVLDASQVDLLVKAAQKFVH